MAGKQLPGENFTSQLAGMSKNQLYDIMSQMKTLIEQNQLQARQILVENPLLTKTLFQAQIMLGMVQPPKVMPNIQQTLSQGSQQRSGLPTNQPPNIPVTQQVPGHSGGTQLTLSPSLFQFKQQESSQSIPVPPVSGPPLTISSQTGTQHSKGHVNAQVSSISLPQVSQIHNAPITPLHPTAPVLQPPVSSQTLQQPLATPGIHLQSLQPPLPPQPRPTSLPPFSHQIHSQIGHGMGLQTPQQLISQAMFHSGINPPGGIGSSFPHGQLPGPNQPPHQQLYQGGAHGADYSNSKGPSPMQLDRGPSWMPGAPESSAGGVHLPGPPPLAPGQMASAMQPSRPPQLTPEMEKALLQQVMSLTPEQINLLPPEQRQQVLQLQQMLR